MLKQKIMKSISLHSVVIQFDIPEFVVNDQDLYEDLLAELKFNRDLGSDQIDDERTTWFIPITFDRNTKTQSLRDVGEAIAEIVNKILDKRQFKRRGASDG